MATGAKIGDLFFDVSADVGRAAAGIPAAGAKIGASLTKSIGGAISKSVSVITAPIVSGFETAAAAGVALFGTVLTTGFGRLRAIDDAQGKLRALGHTTEETAAIMDSALQAVIGTQYNMGEAATIAASAVAAGIKPGQELTKYLQLIADTATVSGLSLEQTGAIINKTTAFQRVYLREINQLANKGLPVFTWLQEAYGVTGEKLREMVSNGEVDAATFQRVIAENIGGAAVEFGLSTFSGGLRNTFAAMGRLGETLLAPFFNSLRDTVFPTAIALFDELNERLKPVMTTFNESEGFQNFLDSFSELPSKVGPFIEMLEKFGPLIALVTALLGATGLGQLKNLLGPFGAFLPKINPILAVFIGLATVSPELREGIMAVVRAIGDLFSEVDAGGAAGGLNNLVKLIGQGLGGALMLVAEWIPKLKGPLSAIAPFISDVLGAFQGSSGIGANLKKEGEGVNEFAQTIGKAFRGIVDGVVDAWPTIQQVAINVFNGVRATIEAVIVWVQKNWPTIKKVAIDVFNAVRATIEDVVAWIEKNWPGIRDTVIEVFNTILTWVRANWPQIRDTVLEVVGRIQAAIQWFATNILPHLINGFQQVAAFVREIWPKVQETIVNVLTAIRVAIEVAAATIAFIWEHFGQTILMAVQAVWDAIKGHIQGALDVINGILNVFIGIFTLDWERVWNGVKQFVDGIWTEIKTIIQLAIDTIGVVINGALDLLEIAWDAAWNAMKSALEGIWNAMLSYIETIPGAILGALSELPSLLIASGNAVIQGLWDGAVSVWNLLSGWLNSLPDMIKEAFAGAITLLFDLGMDILQGLWNGVKYTWELFFSWLGNLGTWILDKVDDLKDVLVDIGKAIMNGLWNGMKEVWNSITGWLSGLNPASWKGPPERDAMMLVENGRLIMQGLQNGMAQEWQNITNWLRNLDPAAALNNTVRNKLMDELHARSGAPNDVRILDSFGNDITPGSSNGGTPPIDVKVILNDIGNADVAVIGAAAASGAESGLLSALAQYTKARG